MMNPWHDVDPGKDVPEVVQCVIEIPRGGHLKYELEKESGLLRLKRRVRRQIRNIVKCATVGSFTWTAIILSSSSS